MTPLEKLQAALLKHKLDALLVCAPHNRLYATGFSSTAGALLITSQEALFLTDFRYYESAGRVPGLSVSQVDRMHTYEALTREFFSAHSVSSVGFEEDCLTCAELKKWQEGLPGFQFCPASDLIHAVRSVKTPEELSKIRRAQQISEIAFEAVLPCIRPNVSEQEIAAELVYQMMRAGGKKVSFDPIVVAGKNGALPHGAPSASLIRDGDFVTMDFGCIYEGYCSDMTRTVAVGHVTDEMRQVYNTVLEAQSAGIAAARAGISGNAADAAGRAVIEAAGYGKFFGHSFGHGVGVEIHENPHLAPGSAELLEAGMVVSAEPGIYLPGRLGVRIEDLIIITENGCENLNHSSKELLILG